MSLDFEVVAEIAAELGIDRAFVVKDWYSVQVLKAISAYQSDSISTVFSGGTSLSKGYGLIQRFSEDLDFRCRYKQENSGSRKKLIRSAYRAGTFKSIHGIDSIDLDETQVSIASNYIKIPLRYPQHYDDHSALRPNLEVEFSFTQPRLKPESRSIQSLISEFTGTNPETGMLCLSPIETGADKLSALIWRILKRDRSDQYDDPAMIRHLHDLSALSEVIKSDQELYVKTTRSAFEDDQKITRRNTDEECYQSMLLTLEALTSDAEYQSEYSQFVDAMSYADDEDIIDFNTAVNSFEWLTALFK